MSKNIHQPKPTSETKTVFYTIARLLDRALTVPYDFYHFRSAYLRGGRDKVGQLKKELNDQRVRRAITDLKRRQYLNAKIQGDRLLLSLTNKGKLTLLKRQLQLAPADSSVSTLVVFDIPESQRWGRDQLRRWLKDCGFKMVQRSVWIINRNVTQPLAKIVKQLKLSAWIRIFLTKNPS